MQAYSNPKRESDPHALPDVEVFALDGSINDDVHDEDGRPLQPGWYWWPCFPGCLPDGEPNGPFATEAEALADAQEGNSGLTMPQACMDCGAPAVPALAKVQRCEACWRKVEERFRKRLHELVDKLNRDMERRK